MFMSGKTRRIMRIRRLVLSTAVLCGISALAIPPAHAQG